MNITKIVVTGGPCAGKSTALSWIQNAFSQRGYTVLFVPETATELISGGVAPWTCGTNLDFQKGQMRLQLEKEAIFEQAARTMNNEKLLIVCDRGALDNKAYMDDEEYEAVLKGLGKTHEELLLSYDAVFHLVTAANGAEQFYTLENNAARTESPEEAMALDDKLIAAWTGHPHLRVIDNSTDFENKMKRLISGIAHFLGEGATYETERMFLIEYPDIKWLESVPNIRHVEIVQTFLESDKKEEVRVRRRNYRGHSVYFLSSKLNLNGEKQTEIECRLTESEYIRLLMNSDTRRKQVRKDRYCLTYENRYFKLDVFPFWNDKAIAAVELVDEDTDIVFPENIKVIREITNDETYKNPSWAVQ